MSEAFWEIPTTARPQVPGCEADVVVMGGGVTGLCTALLLARAELRVVVLEADRIGALASGRNTGKVSLLQGTRMSSLLSHHPTSVVEAYVEANREGVAWLGRFCEDHNVTHERRDAVTYAGAPDEGFAVADELRAGQRLGVPVEWSDGLDVPFAVYGAVKLADQVQLDPASLIDALAAEVERHGGRIAESSRVVDVSWGPRPEARTHDGRRFRSRHLVLATGAPVLDRGLYFAKLEAHRSYLLAYDHSIDLPGMLLSAGAGTRSLRDAPGDKLLVGGAGHVVGRGQPELAGVDELRAWVVETFPGAVETHAWSAQDYASHDGIPYIGKFPRGFGRIWLATGYNKWGLSNAASAALRIAGSILGSSPSWARPLERRITRPAAATTIVRRNLSIALIQASRLGRAETTTVSPELPSRTGDVGRVGIDPRPVGVVSAGCAVRATCTHLGGTLRWNDAERSWDCPLHGSRFSEDGHLIEGPAVRDLDQLDDA